MSNIRFFYKHAGYSWNPATETRNQGRWRCARELAAAERDGQASGFAFEWREDEAPWEHSACDPDICDDVPTEVLGCIVRDRHGEVLGSLWGIADPSREYRRVVQAELASEALAEIRASVFDAV